MQKSSIVLTKDPSESRISSSTPELSTKKAHFPSEAERRSPTSQEVDFAAFVERSRRSPHLDHRSLTPTGENIPKLFNSNRNEHEAMQLSLAQQQHTDLNQLDKVTNSVSAIVAGVPTAESPNSTRGDTGKETGAENSIAAAMAAVAATGVSSSGFSPASLLSSHLGTQQMQQLLSQQVLSPGQLQAIMQQQQVMAAQHQAQHLQELYRQQQKQIQDFQMQITRHQGKRSGSQNDLNNNNNSTDDSKFGTEPSQPQLQQQIALQQLVQLQQMHAQHQQHQQAAAMQQQQGLAAAAAAALAHGRQLPPLPSPELQQIWKQMTDSMAFQAAAVMAAAAGGKNKAGEQCDSASREQMFSSMAEERKLEVNGDAGRKSSRDSSPGVASNTVTNSATSLFSHGVCKWPGCDSECTDIADFRRHLNQDHRLDDKSTAQCRVQMQVVDQLEKQLNQERERLNAMMSHLHNMEDILRDHQHQQDRDSGRGQDAEDSRHGERPAPPLLKPDLALPHPLTQAGAHIMGPMFNSVTGSVLGAAGSSLSLPSSPNGFSSPMLPSSLSHSPPSMASHFSASNARDNTSMMQSSRRRHSNAMPISAELSQNQEFYKNADVRPPYTYASLIRQAIIETPDHQLTLNEIYNWFQRKFAYFRRNTATWKNAVRHNLSLHKCFVRVENVKGAVWTVDENEYQKRRPQKFSGSPIMRGRVEPPCYYGNSINPNIQITLGDSFNPALLASQAQAAALLGSQAFGKLSQQTSSTVSDSNSSRPRKRSPSPMRQRYADDGPNMEKIKKERPSEMVKTEMNSVSAAPDSPSSPQNKASVDGRNANNNSSKYAPRANYSPNPQSPEPAAPIDMSRTSPILRARQERRHEESDAAQSGRNQIESDASAESDTPLEGDMQQTHHSGPVLPTRGSFTMLHEQTSD